MKSLRSVFVFLISIGVGNARYYPVGGYYGTSIEGGANIYRQGLNGGFRPQPGPRFGSFQLGRGGARRARVGYFQGPPLSLVGIGSYSDFSSWPLINDGPGIFRASGLIGDRVGPGSFGYENLMYGGRPGRQGNIDIGGLRSIAERFRGQRMRPFRMSGQTWEFGGGFGRGFGPLYGYPSTGLGANNFGYGITRMGRRPFSYSEFGRGGFNGLGASRFGGTRYGGFGQRRFGRFGLTGFGGLAPGSLDRLGDNGNTAIEAPQFTGRVEGNFGGEGSSVISLPIGKQRCTCRKQCGPGEAFAGKCKECSKKLCLVRCCPLLPF